MAWLALRERGEHFNDVLFVDVAYESFMHCSLISVGMKHHPAYRAYDRTMAKATRLLSVDDRYR